ncbi:glycerophosphodiester phosphodiesterase family protein [Aliikangiella sp. G2MR2-5]|uniref:glycerophosphodiester phosphodiesterase n=1 Tax=Aliikangiella sp. G2MR2-5 TaxID=2788943 RepID=UPI0018AAE41D|nr:glycerophosphodiester phosphodiesterase family protein [Aliikangiella sp. G2MR2-5]
MKVIAHRGASGHEPENTLLAIETAMKMHVDAIEIDVHLAGGELVVIHDRWLEKTTNGQGRVGDMTLEELKKLDAGKGQKIPTLWEVLELIGGRCDLNIELKSTRTVEPTLELLYCAIDELGFNQLQFIISSFNHHLLKQIKKIDKTWRTGALCASLPLDYARFAKRLHAYSVHIDVDFVDKAFVDDAHKRGLKVFVYTVDQEADIDELMAMSIDGIFTNYPTRSMVRIAHLQTRLTTI